MTTTPPTPPTAPTPPAAQAQTTVTAAQSAAASHPIKIASRASADFAFTGIPGTPWNLERAEGGFGKPGGVTMSGVPLEVTAWTDTKIRGAVIKKSIPFGEVVVTNEAGQHFKA